MTYLLHAFLRSSLLIQGMSASAPPPTRPVVSADSAATRTLAASRDYGASGLKRLLLGSGWRTLWTTPVNAPTFNIDTFAGGLELKERGGGMQSLSLHFVEHEGWREYSFRSVDKFPLIQAMPAALNGTLSGKIMQDQVSAFMPAAPLMVAPLLDAVGVLHVTPALFVMPNDTRLGVWRDTFALMLGTVELNPHEAPDNKPGFAGSDKIVSADKFLVAVRESRAVRLEEREFLAARLVDFLINDPDRTRDNIRFARFGQKGAYTWRPLPRDRDQAFMDARGLLNDLVMRPVFPKLAKFEPAMVLEGLVFGTHSLDRRLLQRLSGADVDSIALRVQRAITNDVIDAVVAAMPEAWRDETIAPARVRSVLRTRRDHLPAFAHEFYRWLATEVDLHGTDEDESTVIERLPDGRVTVTIRGKDDATGAEPFLERTFLPDETREVRVYLHDGNDVAVVRGAPTDRITVRLIGGKGNDVLADSAGGGGTHLYDSEGDNRLIGADAPQDVRPWSPPADAGGLWSFSEWRPDWGGGSGWGPATGFAHGAGVLVGFGPRYTRYGFRRLPYRLQLTANAMVGVDNWRPGVTASADYRAENSPLAMLFNVRATRFEEFSFSGFGNATARLGNDRSHVFQDLLRIEPSVSWRLGWNSRDTVSKGLKDLDDAPRRGLRPLVGTVEAGLLANWTNARPPSDSTPFAQATRDGRDVEGRFGARLRIAFDRTSRGDVPDRGFALRSEVTAYPAIAQVNSAFATAALTGAAYVPVIGGGTHIALRAGGAIASAGVPLLSAPAIGGRVTVRGFEWRRFTGDRTAYGSAELRVPVGTLPLFIKWNTGVFALADAGRVWSNGRSDGAWHAGYGGGMWFSTLGQTFSVAWAYGEKSAIYFQRGASF